MTTQFAVALVTPLTGPLATGGLASLRAATLWARDEQLPPPWTEVTLTAYDAHPDPVAAMRSAIEAEPHALLGPSGDAAALAAVSMTKRLVFNHGAPTTRFVRQAFPNIVNMAAPRSSWAREALATIRANEKRVRGVILLTGTGNRALETVAVARAAAAARGFELTVSGFRPGRAAAAARRLPPGDVLIVDAEPEDEIAAAEVLLDRPWRAAAFSSAGDATSFAVLGGRRDGLLAPRSWVPEANSEVTDGPTAEEFTTAYRALHGGDPTATAARAYAAGVIIARCVRASAGSDDVSLAAAARGLDTTTLFGRFQLDPVTGLQVGHRIRIIQWQDTTRVLVWPPRASQAPYRHRLWRPAAAVGAV